MFERAVGIAAAALVRDVVSVALRKATREIRRPLLTLSRVLDGQRVLLSLRSLEHFDFVASFSSSSSSSSTAQKDDDDSNSSGASLRPPPRAMYSLASHTYETRAPVDSTARMRAPERLLFQVYDPIDGFTVKETNLGGALY